MTTSPLQDALQTAGTEEQGRQQSLAGRIAELYACDEQFRAADPDREAIAAARRPGMRLTEVLETFVAAYADRPALGQRARRLVTDPASGRTTSELLPWFDTISYRDLWARVGAIATALRHAEEHPVSPGDVLASVGFASADYLVFDLVCAYLGLVSVPLPHVAPVSQLRPIVAEIEPRVLAVSAESLDLAVEAALNSTSLRHLIVFDYEPRIDQHRDGLARARTRLREAGMPVDVATADEIVDRGESLPRVAAYVGDSCDRLAMILYTSGSTGAPKGAMYTELMVTRVWISSFVSSCDTPVLNVNFMPLNHIGGRLPLVSSFQSGGTSYFVPESDLSTLFEDWALVRPTEVLLVPRVADMLLQTYRAAVDRRIADGVHPDDAERKAASELRDDVLGGRVLGGFTGTAPVSAEMKEFLDSVLGVHIADGYGMTEVGAVTKDGAIARPPIIDYKLVDVPELGYFHTDRPYPRGELLIKSVTATPGYYKRPELTAEMFDADGYYRTGDVMAEIAPDRLVYVDRRNNVLKLAHGEFVAVAQLETVFVAAPLVEQIFVYGNSERSHLLAVVVPTADALRQFGDDHEDLKAALRESLRQTAIQAELRSYELPVNLLVETEPFSADNGLLSVVGKPLRPKFIERYGARLEQMYADIAAAAVEEVRALRESAAERPIVETVVRAARAMLGLGAADIDPEARFTDLGGDSLSALTFAGLLADIFGVDVPVAVVVGPTTTLASLAEYVAEQRLAGIDRPTVAAVHGPGPVQVRASDLTLEKFIDDATLANAPALPHGVGEPHTVLLTGATGWLGRFLALEWLERLSRTGGTLITIGHGRDSAHARARLEKAFDSGDPELLARFRELAADHLEVLAGDIGERLLGLDEATWARLSDRVDMIVHSAAMVNHVLPYEQLFGPNVVGTAEVIRLAITGRIKPVTYLSTVAVAMNVQPSRFEEDGDIRTESAVRPVDTNYANGYANSKWAGEVLLREAHDLCGLPVAVFRSDMILAHSRYRGQVNASDAFTRLIVSLIATGVAPTSFYEREADGARPRAHYGGLPVDFVAEAIASIGANATEGYRSFNALNPHDDGVSLDVVVDWLISAGNRIERIDDYGDWVDRFETALRGLPDRQRQQSVLPLIHAYRRPEAPLRGAPAPTEAFRAAVRAAKIGPDHDIPHLSAMLVNKYVSDLRALNAPS